MAFLKIAVMLNRKEDGHRESGELIHDFKYCLLRKSEDAVIVAIDEYIGSWGKRVLGSVRIMDPSDPY